MDLLWDHRCDGWDRLKTRLKKVINLFQGHLNIHRTTNQEREETRKLATR